MYFECELWCTVNLQFLISIPVVFPLYVEYIWTLNISSVCICIHTNTQVYIYIYTHVCVCVCVSVCACVCVCVGTQDCLYGYQEFNYPSIPCLTAAYSKHSGRNGQDKLVVLVSPGILPSSEKCSSGTRSAIDSSLCLAAIALFVVTFFDLYKL